MPNRYLALAAVLVLGGCAPLTGNQAQDTATIQTRIERGCVAAPIVKGANSLAGALVPVPGAALAAELVNAGITVGCSHPDFLAKEDAKVADWTMEHL